MKKKKYKILIPTELKCSYEQAKKVIKNPGIYAGLLGTMTVKEASKIIETVQKDYLKI